MTQALSIVGSMNNGVSSQLLANLGTARSVASDLSGSIFNSSMPMSNMPSTYLNGPGMGMGMGMYPGMGMGMMGMYNPLMMNQMYQQIQASNADFQHKAMDRASDWNVEHAWKNDINQTQITAKDEEFRNKVLLMKKFIEQNNPDAAYNMYHTLLNMASKKYNPEISGNRRLDAKNANKALVNQIYEQYAGSRIEDDIEMYCKDSTSNAWEDGLKLRWMNGHKLSKDTFKAIVTDQDPNTVIGEGTGKKVLNYGIKGLGTLTSATVPVIGGIAGKWAGAKIGAKFGKNFGFAGALIGAGIGLAVTLFANSRNNKQQV
ncbi:glycine zipper family protein [bacterium]|nr:glycine zipper family protein [bacterium]